MLNDRLVEVTEDRNLLEYLREEARMVAVKDGCSEGVCGTCTILVDGKALRACKLTVAKVAGKHVMTPEGMADAERQVYSWAFGKTGAVQCGFCMPGILMSAKALVHSNPEPSKADIKSALRYNICRCAGYSKIEDAIGLAAKALRERNIPEHTAEQQSGSVGARSERIESSDKLLGTAVFVDDMTVPGMLHAAVLRPRVPRALINHIDTSAAQALPGVELVLTAKDVPGERSIGHIVHDWPVMIAEGEVTRYVGDALAIVAATSRELAHKAIELIDVEWDELPPLLSPQAAMASDAPQLHAKGNLLSTTVMKRGDVDRAIADAAHVVSETYFAPRQEHAFLEPESALAVPNEDGTLTVYSGSQGVYDDHREIMRMLGVPGDKVRVISKFVGGGFGGKEDCAGQHHAALLAWISRKPVKLTFTRAESLAVHPKRHPMWMEYTSACDADGRLTAVRARIDSDTGAYASLGGPVLQRACTHGAGPYKVDNVDVEGRAWYTNNIPSGAFRGFGVTQTCFAMESQMNLLAKKVGISQWEMRWRNAVGPGDVMSNGQFADDSTALKETLLAVKPIMDAHPDAGIASSFKNTGKGVGVQDVGRVKLLVRDAKVVICSSAACMGQGLATVLLQIVAQTARLEKSQLLVHDPDTAMTPDSGTSTASRQTTITGEAARRAALLLREQLDLCSVEELEGREFLGEYAAETDAMTSDKPNRTSHIAYGFATQVVVLGEDGKVARVVAAHDVGKAINPNGVEGQIEGGVVMGLSYALTENFVLREGVPVVTFGTLGLWRAQQVPPIEPIIIEKSNSERACGAKGIGEIVMLTTAPAVAGAYFNRDGKLRTSLPLEGTPYSRRTRSSERS